MLSIKKGVTYIRVSSQRQVTEGNGLDSQLRSCQAYAKENGILAIPNYLGSLLVSDEEVVVSDSEEYSSAEEEQ